MGENEGWSETGGRLPNGLLSGATPVMVPLDSERWLRAEERTRELIACIQPNPLSEERRNAVADYVQQLIMKCFPCQVCTFGSVPLKTYLPDGDIDLTTFSHDQNIKDTWASLVRDMLENEEKNENAEFHVKEVQYIQAEVKIIKCLVENIVVDISFNQVGGLCTLCFLDEVDNLIGQNHLFKRSIILIKAWCYYESRILGAHHGLISTYALETLVLYIFHVFNNSFHGPLEVLYRFLEFFSNFDWDHFCVSLWGPVPISSLPDVTAEPPCKDNGDLLLSKLFLDACSSVYAVFPGGQETNGQQFVSKHFNVIDPLRISNNLGRSVSKGNFYRIRSAFSFGAKRLARLLDCPNENIVFEVNQFFMNTWERHGSGRRPDAAGVDSWQMRLPNPDGVLEFHNSNYDATGNVGNEKCSFSSEIEDEGIQDPSASSRYCDTSAAMIPQINELAASHMQTLKSQKLRSLLQTENFGRDNASHQVSLKEAQKDTKVNHLVNESHGRFLFARTRSSPELTDAYADGSQVRRYQQVEDVKINDPTARLGATNRRKNLGSGGLASSIRDSSVKDTSSAGNASLQITHDTGATESHSDSNSCYRDTVVDTLNDEISSTSGPHVNQEEQEIVNMMASASLQGFNSQLRVPFDLSSANLPFSIPPTFLASMGYSPRHMPGFLPSSFPLIDSPFSNVEYHHGMVSPQLTNYFPGMGMNPPSEASFEQSDQMFSSPEVKSVDVDEDSWHEQGIFSSGGDDNENGDFDLLVPDYKPQSSVSDLKYVPPPRHRGSGSGMKFQQKQMRGKRGSMVQSNDTYLKMDDRNSEVNAEKRSVSSRFSSATQSTSLRSRTSSESSWDGSSQKASKSTNEKRSKRITSMDQATGHGKGKIMISEHVPYHTEADEQEWVLSSNIGAETIERNSRSDIVAPLQVGKHVSCLDAAQTSGADSMIPFAPMLINAGSRQRGGDESGLVAFYPTGPPIPFLTMLPVYNMPEADSSDTFLGHFSGDENPEANEPGQNFIPERFGDSGDRSFSGSSKEKTASEQSEKKKSDILNSDFASHWQNLQFGRFCQNMRFQGPIFYPSPVMVPPTYLPGLHSYENPVRPLSNDMNLMSQLMASYGQRLVPVTPLRPVSSRPPNMYQHYIDDMPRYRSGTGTYLPNPVSVRERNSPGARRGNHKEDRGDTYSDREGGNWNGNSKSRAGMRSRSNTEKLNLRADRLASTEGRADNTWNSYRYESDPPYQSQNGQLISNSSQNGPQNVAYNTYPLAALNPNGLSDGPVPPVVMVYPFDNNSAYSGEQLEFGSLGPVRFPVADEQLQLNEGRRTRVFVDPRFHGRSGRRSSPDQPSSPNYQRRV